ncbi:MAG: hypothetical protein ACE5HB_11250 [Terriglobia bacterium]
MNWLLRLAAFLLALVFLRWLWRWGLERLFGEAARRVAPQASRPERQGTVKRDPICGTFVDVELSLQEKAGAETLHFCSERCRETYRSRRRDEQARQRPAAQNTG